MKEYQVILTDKKQTNGEKFSEADFWKKANCLTDFCSPWKTDSFSNIEFKALWNSDHFFFNFKVYDADIYIDLKDDTIESIGNSDRVELFFRVNDKLNPYYCLEMDTHARVMDFKSLPNKNFDFNWNWPKTDLEVKASLDENSFSVKGRINLKSLKELNLIHNNTLEVGVFRAKYAKDENLNYHPTWISWVNPNTEFPNFHIATSFGKFILVE